MVSNYITVLDQGPNTLPYVLIHSTHQFYSVLFCCVFVAGIMQTCVAQPFDTIKVKLQIFPKIYKNMFACFSHTVKNDGYIRGLYAGTLPAIVASVAENSVLFASYGGCQSFIASIFEISETNNLSIFGNACAGVLSAFFTAFTLCPTELVKCKLQAISEVRQPLLHHLLLCLIMI